MEPVNISWSEEISDKYIPEIVLFKDLWQLTIHEHLYAAGKFYKGHRSISDWRGGNNCIILDIDNNCTIAEMVSILDSRKLMAFITTTRNHGKEKNGTTCDRFRVIIPVSTAFFGTVEEYRNIMSNVHSYFFELPDRIIVDPSRCYFGNPNQEYLYTKGTKKLHWHMFTSKKQVKKEGVEMPPSGGNADSLIKWGIANIKSGNRNNALYWIYNRCKENGYDPIHVIRSINTNMESPLDSKELNKILRL